jgi:hypothetical protein
MFKLKICFGIFLLLLLFSCANASNIGLIENSTWQNNLTAVRFSTTSFGDINNDNNPDLIITGCLNDGANDCTKGTISKVYINNGTTLTESFQWEQNLTGVGWGSNGLGDINNDGKLDLVLIGCTSSDSFGGNCDGSFVAKIYINNGTTLTESFQWEQNLTGVYDSSLALGDINNDGKLDLAVNGIKASSPYITKIYINNGTNLIENSTWEQNLIGVYRGQIVLGDLNNDGYLDATLSGEEEINNPVTRVYINNGTNLIENSTWEQNLQIMSLSSLTLGNIFNEINGLDLLITGKTSSDLIFIYKNNLTTFLVNQTRDEGILMGLYRASLALGDYNNDGYLDFIGFGHEHGRAKIYENKKGYFVEDSLAHSNISDGILEGASAWSDIDKNGCLDLVITAADFDLGLPISKVYINNGTISNTLPLPPTTFTSSYSATANKLSLTWGNGSDSETPTAGLYYNLMVGNSTNNNSIVSGVYGGSSGGGGGSGGGANGYFGNMMQRKSISLNINLSNGTYYWYVQTIDTGLAKSSWSARQSFIVGTTADTTAPTISSGSASVVALSTATITWTTNEASNSTVNYGKTTALGSESDSGDLVSSHSVNLFGLSSSTLYYYTILSCDSSNNCNTSSQYSFTTSDASTVNNDNGNNNPGGGSSGGSPNTQAPVWTQTYSVSDEQFNNGYTKELSAKNRLQISVNNETHYVGVTGVTNSTATLNITSESQIATLFIGDIRRFEVTGDNYYDLNVTLNSINSTSNKANITVISVHDEITAQTIAEEQTKETTAQQKKKEDIKNERKLWFYLIVGFIIILIIMIIILLIKNLKKKDKK